MFIFQYTTFRHCVPCTGVDLQLTGREPLPTFPTSFGCLHRGTLLGGTCLQVSEMFLFHKEYIKLNYKVELISSLTITEQQKTKIKITKVDARLMYIASHKLRYLNVSTKYLNVKSPRHCSGIVFVTCGLKVDTLAMTQIFIIYWELVCRKLRFRSCFNIEYILTSL